MYSKSNLDAGARNFSRTPSDSSPAYTLRLFAFPDQPAGAGAKEVALQGYRQSDPAAGNQAYGVPDRRGYRLCIPFDLGVNKCRSSANRM